MSSDVDTAPWYARIRRARGATRAREAHHLRRERECEQCEDEHEVAGRERDERCPSTTSRAPSAMRSARTSSIRSIASLAAPSRNAGSAARIAIRKLPGAGTTSSPRDRRRAALRAGSAQLRSRRGRGHGRACRDTCSRRRRRARRQERADVEQGDVGAGVGFVWSSEPGPWPPVPTVNVCTPSTVRRS